MRRAGPGRGPSPRDTLTRIALVRSRWGHEIGCGAFGNAQKTRSRGEAPAPALPAACRRSAGRTLALEHGVSAILFRGAAPYWQVMPLAVVFGVFFLMPLLLTFLVSFWRYNEYSMIPGFVWSNYASVFQGCADELPGLCLTFKTYWSTLKLCAVVWAVTLVLGFTIAYFLVFPRAVAHHADGAVPRVHDPVLDVQRHPDGLVGAAARAERRRQLVPAGVGIGATTRRVAPVLELLRRRRLRAPVHDVHDRADLQFHEPDRPVADRGGL